MATIGTLTVLGLLFWGWVIESEMKELRSELSNQLVEILSAAQKIRVTSCGNKNVDRMMEETASS